MGLKVALAPVGKTFRARVAGAARALLFVVPGLLPLSAKADQIGSASGLPVPRYVSLKSDRVNLREGPSTDHRTVWIFERAGLPVEITAEFETWRKVRDSEGSEGWVLHSLLSGRRTGLVTPWKKDGPPIVVFAKPSEGANLVAKLAPNVLTNIRSCDKAWCRVNGEGFDGFVKQAELWGVYPNEVID
jgi:SH3-like domain-containing protein